MILGLSPYESPWALWQRMAGRLDLEPDNPDMERGRFHEAGVLAWFKAHNPQLRVRANRSTWVSRSNERFAATPDGFILDDAEGRAGLEVKTSAYHDWVTGPPPMYRAQAVWQCHVLGMRRVYLVALTRDLQHMTYVIDYDPAEGEYIAEQAEAFLRSLDDGVAPPIDGHDATTRGLRDMHPDIDPATIDLDVEDVASLVGAKENADVWADVLKKQRNLIAARMGNAEHAEYDGRRVASRRSRSGGVPYLQLAQKLPKTVELPLAVDERKPAHV